MAQQPLILSTTAADRNTGQGIVGGGGAGDGNQRFSMKSGRVSPVHSAAHLTETKTKNEPEKITADCSSYNTDHSLIC